MTGTKEGVAIVVIAQDMAVGGALPRLAEEIGGEKATEVYRCFVADAIGRVRRVAREAVYLAVAGSMEPIAPDGIEAFESVGATLGERLRQAFDHCLSLGHDRVIAVDAKAPNVPVRAVSDAIDHLRFLDLAIGPREGGGAYLIGSRGRYADYFLDVPWEERPDEGQIAKTARQCGLEYAILDAWYTVETSEDLRLLQQFLQFDISEDNPCPNTVAWLKANFK